MIRPDLYEGILKLPAEPAPTTARAPVPVPESAFEVVASLIEELYAAEPRRTRALLEALRAASTEDLERLFKA
jgi:hypothetical protein